MEKIAIIGWNLGLFERENVRNVFCKVIKAKNGKKNVEDTITNFAIENLLTFFWEEDDEEFINWCQKYN